MFNTFKAKIHGTFVMSTVMADSVDTTLTFTKYKIRVTDKQIGKLFLDPMGVLPITDKMEYSFDKLLDKEDEKFFSIIRKHKLNSLDNGVAHLDIDIWNKFKANLIHKRCWVQKNADWFLKTIIAVLVGAIIGAVFNERGYQRGFQEGLKNKQYQHQLPQQ